MNSIRARLEHVVRWLQSAEPDLLLLQELKGTDFPGLAFEELGYRSEAVTQKAYNGVAVLSRVPFETVCTSLAGESDDDHARFLEVRVAGLRVVNLYLPNGNPVGTEKFEYKLAWMDRLLAQMSQWRQDGVPTLIAGDFNVIPEDIDCHKPASWTRDALFQPETRERFRAMLRMGYVDAFRALYPEETGQFTYWDYFRDAFARNRGIRIDHFLLSPELVGRLESCTIDKGPRGESKPSDHTPVIVTLRDDEGEG